MRLIAIFNNEKDGLHFSSFLNSKDIPNVAETDTDKDWGSDEYGTGRCSIWVQEEDQVEEAVRLLELFRANPRDPQFKLLSPGDVLSAVGGEKPVIATPLPLSPFEKPESGNTFRSDDALDQRRDPPMGPATRFILFGCCLLFFFAQLLVNTKDVPPSGSPIPIFSSPIEKALLYDYPYVYELIDRAIRLYGYDVLQDPGDLPPEGQQLVRTINHTPYWQGFYQIFLQGDFTSVFREPETVPMFEKIREGQIWRLLSPIFLHANLLHLFFNMLWLIVLGKQLELHMGIFRYGIFIVIAGIISNTGQYLAGGPNFLGFSGVLCAMLTFIWVRQRKAPWEGYRLDRGTIMFMLLYIIIMAAIQMLSFVLEKSMNVSFSPGLANMAHLTGALVGVVLGGCNFFSRRPA